MGKFICLSLQEIETEETNELDSFLLRQPKVQRLDARRLLNARNSLKYHVWGFNMNQTLRPKGIYKHWVMRPELFASIDLGLVCRTLIPDCLHGGVICMAGHIYDMRAQRGRS
jgi:hypothetical protein